MLTRRTLLGGLLACIPLFGMKNSLNKRKYISFVNHEKSFPVSYDNKEIFASVIVLTNTYFEVFDITTVDSNMFNVLVLIGASYEWIHRVNYKDCVLLYK